MGILTDHLETGKITLGAAAAITNWAGVGVPPGVVAPYAGAAAPSGWLLCDGSAVSRETYADLFTVLGTTFGVGDGSTTFNVPNVPAGYFLCSGTPDGVLNADSTAVKGLTVNNNDTTHNHTASSGNNTANHRHGPFNSTVNNRSHNHATGGNSGTHNHEINGVYYTTSNCHNHNAGAFCQAGSPYGTAIVGKTVNAGWNHTHDVGNNNVSHYHNNCYTDYSDAAANHSHAITVNNGNAEHNHGLSGDSVTAPQNVKMLMIIKC